MRTTSFTAVNYSSAVRRCKHQTVWAAIFLLFKMCCFFSIWNVVNENILRYCAKSSHREMDMDVSGRWCGFLFLSLTSKQFWSCILTALEIWDVLAITASLTSVMGHNQVHGSDRLFSDSSIAPNNRRCVSSQTLGSVAPVQTQVMFFFLHFFP